MPVHSTSFTELIWYQELLIRDADEYELITTVTNSRRFSTGGQILV
jgi:hypothetical protein